MNEAIRRLAIELGFDACRFTTADRPEGTEAFQRWLKHGRHGTMDWMARTAGKRVNPGSVLDGAKSVVVLVASYYHETLGNEGFIARYARYKDYHDVLSGKLKILAGQINGHGGENARSLWYVDTGPLLERDLAQRAGAGFIGKHTNLISRQFGNWLFLAEILTTVKFEPDPPEKNRCGKCVWCINACPTDAIVAPFELDSRLCISFLTIELKDAIPMKLRPAIGNRIYGCDDCLEVCPWNRFARQGRLMKPHYREDLDPPQLLELLELDEDGFRARFRGTPMERTKRRGMLRNVCVALGNTAGPSALPALKRAAHDPEPLIAEHAKWAIDRILQRE